MMSRAPGRPGGRLPWTLRRELVDHATARARAGKAIGRLPAEVREQLTDDAI